MGYKPKWKAKNYKTSRRKKRRKILINFSSAVSDKMVKARHIKRKTWKTVAHQD